VAALWGTRKTRCRTHAQPAPAQVRPRCSAEQEPAGGALIRSRFTSGSLPLRFGLRRVAYQGVVEAAAVVDEPLHALRVPLARAHVQWGGAGQLRGRGQEQVGLKLIGGTGRDEQSGTGRSGGWLVN
jgi:hypothetical protein